MNQCYFTKTWYLAIFTTDLVCFWISISNLGLRRTDKKTEKMAQSGKTTQFYQRWIDEVVFFFFFFFKASVWTMRLGHDSQTRAVRSRFARFTEFLCRASFESKRTVLMDDFWLTGLAHMVRSSFKIMIITHHINSL